jgi:hypothetical protein
MGFTNYPGGLQSQGIPLLGGGAVPFGPTSKTFFVSGAEGSDGNDGTTPKKALASVSAAHSKMRAGKNDVCFLMGNGQTSGTARETATIEWSKDACHLIGVAAPGMVAQRARISPASGSTAVTPIINITADGCVFSDIHLFQNFATAAANVCMAITGERNVFLRCHIAGGGNATAAAHAGTRSLTIAGGNGEHYFKDCVIGLDTIPRGTGASAEIEITAASARNYFEDCLILSRTDGTNHDMLLIGVGGIDRWVIFKKCIFFNDTQGGGTAMAEMLNVVASSGGVVLLQGCTTFGATAVETTNHGEVFMSQEVDTVADVLAV